MVRDIVSNYSNELFSASFSSGIKCWNQWHYCLCFHIGNQVLKPIVLLSLLLYREPSAATHSLLSLLLFLIPEQLCVVTYITSAKERLANKTFTYSKLGSLGYH